MTKSTLLDRLEAAETRHGSWMRDVETADLIKEARTRIQTLELALARANVELAALVPVPEMATWNDWPVENTGDAECLQRAFEAIRGAVSTPEEC